MKPEERTRTHGSSFGAGQDPSRIAESSVMMIMTMIAMIMVILNVKHNDLTLMGNYSYTRVDTGILLVFYCKRNILTQTRALPRARTQIKHAQYTRTDK